MSGPRKNEKRSCSAHLFTMKAKSSACYYQQSISVRFCEEKAPKAKNSRVLDGPCYEGPIFNKDHNFLTSSFILSSEKKKYSACQAGFRCDNQNKYQNFNQEKSELLIPKPNSKNMYCNACKEKYQDYQEHILQPSHKKKVRTSVFNDYISELEKKYKQAHGILKLREKEMTVTQASNLIVIDEQSVEQLEISKPRKRLKMSSNAPQAIRFPNNQQTEQANKVMEPVFNASWLGYYWNLMPMQHQTPSFCIPMPQLAPMANCHPYQVGLYNQYSAVPAIEAARGYLGTNVIDPANFISQIRNYGQSQMGLIGLQYALPNVNFN